MKRVLFALAAIIFSLGLLAFSFFRNGESPITVNAFTGILSGTGDFSLSPEWQGWKVTPSSKDASAQILARKISPLDIAFTPASQADYRIEAGTGWIKKVAIDKGIYAFSFENSLASYTVEFPTFSIRQVSRGTFFVDTRDTSKIRIYSASSILSVTLLSLENKGEKETEFLVFPSMLFEHDPKYNSELKQADIIRIATIHSLTYVPLYNGKNISSSIALDDTANQLYSATLDFLRQEDDESSQNAKTIFAKKAGYETVLFDTFPFLFVNSDKRAILLRNSIFNDLKDLFVISEKADCQKNACDAGRIFASIDTELSNLQDINTEEYELGRELIKNAYFAAFAETSSSTEKTNRVNPFVQLLGRVFKNGITIDSIDYTTLSSVYRDQILHGWDENGISAKMDAYMRTLIANKSIRETDFLPFVHYLKEYLSRPMNSIGTSELDIVYYLVALSNEYYSKLASEDQKFSLLSVYFYNYDKIIGKVAEGIRASYFKSGEPLALKDDFVDPAGEASLWDGFSESMSAIAKAFTQTDPYFSAQLSLYYKYLNSGLDANISDRFTVFQTTLKKFQNLEQIIANYKSYKDQLSLKDDVRGAEGIVFGWATFPTQEEVRTYFSQFSGIDIGGFQITGGGEKDWFYLISFKIDGNAMSLKLLPDGHRIEEVKFVTPAGIENKSFENLSISLDDKQKEISQIGGDRAGQFDHFFQTAFFSGASSVIVNNPGPIDTSVSSGPEMTQEMKVFVDRELIQKDFKNVYSIFPATLSNIYAIVNNGEYDITITNVPAHIQNGPLVESVQFSGKYLFSQTVHAFYRLSISVNTQGGIQKDFGGASITLVPNRIDIQNFEKISHDIPLYIKTLRNMGYTGSEKATFDLSRQTVIIGSNEYPLSQ